jgi:hypothetical protein
VEEAQQAVDAQRAFSAEVKEMRNQELRNLVH